MTHKNMPITIEPYLVAAAVLFIPSGSVVLEAGDTMLGLAEDSTHEQVALLLQR